LISERFRKSLNLRKEADNADGFPTDLCFTCEPFVNMHLAGS